MMIQIEGECPQQRSLAAQRPLVSIIIVVFEACEELRQVMQSIVPHLSEQVEVVVVDGGSTDGTQEVFQEYRQRIQYWISEKDSGIYDAMNKGVAAARGQFLIHVNAGDRLLNLPLRDLSAALEDGVDIAAYRVLVDGTHPFRPSFGIALNFNNTLHHQGTFFRKDSFLAYNTSYKVFADFDVNQRLAARGVRTRIFEDIVAVHSSDGTSHKSDSREFFRIIRHNHGLVYVGIAWFLCKWRGLKVRLGRMGPEK